MIDIIGAISLTAIFGLCCAVLIGAAPVESSSRIRLSGTCAHLVRSHRRPWRHRGLFGSRIRNAGDRTGGSDARRRLSCLGCALTSSAERGAAHSAPGARWHSRGARTRGLLRAALRGGQIAADVCVDRRLGRHRRCRRCVATRLGHPASDQWLATSHICLEPSRFRRPGHGGDTRRWIGGGLAGPVHLRNSEFRCGCGVAVGAHSSRPGARVPGHASRGLRAAYEDHGGNASQGRTSRRGASRDLRIRNHQARWPPGARGCNIAAAARLSQIRVPPGPRRPIR